MRRLWLIGVVFASLLLAGCGGAPTSELSAPFGARALEWWLAKDLAAHEGASNLGPFLDENVVSDIRSDPDGRFLVRGRDAYIAYQEGLAKWFTGGDTNPTEAMTLLLSADGYLSQVMIPQRPADYVHRVGMGKQGAVEDLTSASVQFWRTEDALEYWKPDPLVPRLDDFETLVDRYLTLWNGTGAAAVSDVYDANAVLEDTLVGASVHGAGQIGEAVGTGAWPDLPPVRVMELPPPPEGAQVQASRGLALYVGPSKKQSVPDEVTIVLQADDGAGCPGIVGVSLTVVNDRVVHERRYHQVAQVERCLGASALQRGWWDGIKIPDPVRHALTGRVSGGPAIHPVTVYNGSTQTDRFVLWGLKRFDQEGLTPPDVASVTFLAQRSRCSGLIGFIETTKAGAEVTLCMKPAEVCDNAGCSAWGAKEALALLHELSHAWLDQHASEASRREFMNEEGVARWQDFGDDWAARGVEHAANVMSRGLMDELVVSTPAECAAESVGFKILTGTTPLASCQADPGAGRGPGK